MRVNGEGVVTEVGVLLRADSEGTMTRMLVSGRVMYGETLRTALFRHLEKDLGPMAFPQLPVAGAVLGRRVLPHAAPRSTPTSASTRCRSPTWCRSRAPAIRVRTPSRSPG